LLVLLFGGLGFYVYNLDRILEKDYARAESLVERGDYEAAVDLFRGIYDRHPQFHLAPQALYQSGDVLNLFLNRHREAVLAFLLVEKDYPGQGIALRAQRQVADIYKYRLRDYEQAIVFYQKLLDGGNADGDRLQYEVADTYFRLENYQQARLEFETLVRTYPASPLLAEVAYRTAVTYSLEGKPSEAEAAFRRVTDAWPQSPYALEALFGLATTLEDRDELVEALKILEELAGRYPNAEVLNKKTEQVRERIRKKKRAI
jgi:TolA-binding protein